MHDLPRSPPRRRPDRRRRNAADGGPAQAQTTVNIIANDDDQFVRIDPPGSAPQAPNVLVAPGSVVRFSYPSGASLHNVRFTAKQPATCQITTGPSALMSPIPQQPSLPGWAGERSFTAGGSYPYVCDRHHDPRLGECHARRVAAAGAGVRAPQGAVGRAQQQAGSGRPAESLGGGRRAGRVRSEAQQRGA